MKESDEDEAVQAAENWGQSIAGAGFWKDKRGKMKVWGRSDMDGVHVWVISRGPGEEGEVIEVSIEVASRVDVVLMIRSCRTPSNTQPRHSNSVTSTYLPIIPP